MNKNDSALQRTTRRINTIEYSIGDQHFRDVERRDVAFIGYDPYREGERISIRANRGPADEEWCIQVTGGLLQCRLVNCGLQPVVIKPRDAAGPNKLEPLSGVNGPVAYEAVDYGEPVMIEGYTFTFHRQRLTPSFAIELEPPQTQLTRDHTKHNPLTGTIRLYNKGKQKQIQFWLELVIEDLPSEAYHLGSTRPKLVDKNETEISFSLYHPVGRYWPAGEYQIAVYARANEYRTENGEEVAADFCEVQVQAIYDHELELTIPYPCPVSPGDDP